MSQRFEQLIGNNKVSCQCCTRTFIPDNTKIFKRVSLSPPTKYMTLVRCGTCMTHIGLPECPHYEADISEISN